MAAFWDKEEMLGKITKNNREEIQIKQVPKAGKDYEHGTFWYDSNEDAYKPVKRCLAIPMDALSS